MLTSGAVDFLFELRVKADDSAPAGAWAPETLAADAVAAAAANPAATATVVVVLFLTPICRHLLRRRAATAGLAAAM